MNIILPRIKVKDIEEYFNLPIKKRTKFGLYLIPSCLSFKLFDQVNDWESWRAQIRKEFPIQSWFRENIFTKNNIIYCYKINLQKIDSLISSIKLFFNPLAPRMRKAWPRHEYKIISDAIIDINHALILDFWYINLDTIKENDKFEQQETIHFYNWIEQAVSWIEKEKIELKESYYKELKNLKKNKTLTKDNYKIECLKANKILDIINQKDDKIIKEMIFYRKYFI